LGWPLGLPVSHPADPFWSHLYSSSALPQRVSGVVDVDGDGQPDLRVSFDVPKDAKAPLRVDVEPLNPSYQAIRIEGKKGFSRLIVRVDNSILVRVPLASR
jgi:hypothetical protein